MVKHITATVVFIDLELGFWGLVERDGSKYQPLHFPEQLKHKNATVEVTIQILQDAASLMMWGRAVRIVGFETIK